MSVNLDVLNSYRRFSCVADTVIDLGGSNPQTLLVTSFGSATLHLESGDASGSTTDITGSHADAAAGDDAPINMLVVQIIRPCRNFYKVKCDATIPVLVELFDARNVGVSLDATIKGHKSLNSPDYGGTALRPDGYPDSASI